MSSMRSNDEELRHVPDGSVLRYLRALLDENESGNLTIHCYEKWEAARVQPIRIKVGIVKSSIAIELDGMKLAEVVGIPLEEVVKDRLLLERGRQQLDPEWVCVVDHCAGLPVA